jgi:hypothetical protein
MSSSFEIIYGPKILFKFYNLKFNFLKLSKRPQMEKMTRSEVIDLDEIYNFVVDNRFIRNHLWS